MRAFLAVVSLLFVVGIWGGVARADLAPPDTCTAPGQPCQNAGTSYNQAGVCTAATCNKQVRGPDGGFTSMSYACNLCEAADAGASTGAAGASGTGGAAGGSATGGTTSHGGGSSGCAIAPASGDGHGAEILVVLAAAGLVVARRRRHASR